MKLETKMQKLNEMLGISDKVQEIQNRKNGRVVGVTEEEIQEFREVQGIIYFLQAPKLFTFKICKHCKQDFAVSRKYVACCSYTCIRKDLESQGFEWRKGHDIEGLVQDPHVWNENEPLWVKGNTLRILQEGLETLEKERLSLQSTSPSEENTSSETTQSSPPTTTKSGKQSTPDSSKPKKKVQKRTFKVS